MEVPEPLSFLPQWLLMGLLASSSWTLRLCVSAYLPKGLSPLLTDDPVLLIIGVSFISATGVERRQEQLS